MSATNGTRSPRYVAIAAEIRERILGKQLAPHVLLPSEREMSEQFMVSRMTARQALTLLESEGHVYRRPPRGTFVAEPRVRFHIGSFTQEASRLGHSAHAQLIWVDRRSPDAQTRAALDLGPDAEVHAFCRLRLMEEEPIAIETTFFTADLTPDIIEKADDGSLWALLRDDYDMVLARSEAVLESIILDGESCEYLRVRAASPGILLTRRTFDGDGRCVEFARDVYRADRAAFEVSASLSV